MDTTLTIPSFCLAWPNLSTELPEYVSSDNTLPTIFRLLMWPGCINQLGLARLTHCRSSFRFVSFCQNFPLLGEEGQLKWTFKDWWVWRPVNPLCASRPPLTKPWNCSTRTCIVCFCILAHMMISSLRWSIKVPWWVLNAFFSKWREYPEGTRIV